MESKNNRQYDLVVAFDIGTTYSGYAFSSTEEFDQDPLDIHYIQSWNGGRKRLVSYKTPTCLLLNKNEKINAFGYEAEAKFAELVSQKNYKNYYYFHRFKMKLCKREEITRNMTMKDVTGKSVRALDVFALSIRALLEHFRAQVEIPASKVRYVVTVPANWSDIAKQFMAASAMMAGIPEDQLLIALESEAAAIYCERVLASQAHFKSKKEAFLAKGVSKFMMVDIGGGTTDITVLEKLPGNKMRQLCSSSGGNFGGTTVDECYVNMLEEIIYGSVMRKLKSDHPQSFLNLLNSFEYLKRSLDSEKFGNVNLNMPFGVINSLCKNLTSLSFQELLGSSAYNGQVTFEGGKLRIQSHTLKSFFNNPINEMLDLMKESFKRCEPERISDILLVGGFSQCPLLGEAVKSAFPRKRVHFSMDPSLAVLKGAVLFGHEPSFIASRVVRYTYGVEVSKDYDPRLHPSERRVILDDEVLCRGVFDPFMKAETSVDVGTAIKETYTTTEKFQKAHYLPIYISTNKNPKYTDDDDVFFLGTVSVPIPNPTEHYRDVDVKFYFGFTELEIEAIDVETNEKCEVRFDIL